MLGRERVFLALAIGTTLTVGCGGGETGTGGQGGTTTSTTTTTTTTTSSTSTGAGGDDTTIQANVPVVNLCPDSPVLAVERLYFGEGDSGQWKQYGFNIDGIFNTNAMSTNLCQPADGGMASAIYPEGNNGINNSFGANILPLILGLDSTWPTDVNNAIQAGTFTVLLQMD